MTPRFTLTKAKNGEYYCTLMASNGENLGRSDTYKSKASAQNCIASIQLNAPNPDRYHYHTSANGMTYLSLKAGNGEIILSGPRYTSEAEARSKAVEAISRAAWNAEIKDAT